MKDHELHQLTDLLFKSGKEEKYGPKSVIIEEGTVSRKFYYLKKGILRGWTHYDGKEVTFQFLFENHIFCCSESFFYHQPSSYTVETIEACSLLSVEKTDIDTLSEDITFMNLFNKYLISRVNDYQQLLISQIREKPEMRYKKLLEENPEIILRIPQHLIASYLGMTPVSLSRIRNR
ncbi:Crp/Fnr family transcriptional regulator [Chryseobacterium sp. LAM-KRS1]|uniref:Crp/Fnr family transcriptional regulator n=1 Tax=Chryseobacterium sp. LAM-KRS1 TaxID=2715754 RepID=UPI0015576B41|nr:Crp/Fnr family transcriptional regulator [Chryseobacterium sp. LAM-KRS1]